MRSSCSMALGLLLLVVTPAFAESVQVFWSGYTTGIWTAMDDGSNAHQVIDMGKEHGGGLTIDPANQKLYFTRRGDSTDSGRIQRTNLDGSNLETLATGRVGDVAIDGLGQFYWTSDGIHRAKLDGSEPETIFAEAGVYPTALAIDSSQWKIYWTDYAQNLIRRANLDGSQMETIISSGLNHPRDIDIDQLHGLIYWSEYDGRKIQRANMDGSNLQVVLHSTSTDNINGIAVDPIGGNIYWQQFDWNAGHIGHIRRADLDGANMSDLTSLGVGVYPGDVDYLPAVPEPTGLAMAISAMMVTCIYRLSRVIKRRR